MAEQSLCRSNARRPPVMEKMELSAGKGPVFPRISLVLGWLKISKLWIRATAG